MPSVMLALKSAVRMLLACPLKQMAVVQEGCTWPASRMAGALVQWLTG